MIRDIVRCLIICIFSSVNLTRAEDAPEHTPPKTYLVESGPFEATVDLDGTVQSIDSQEIQVRPEEWTTFIVERAIESGRMVKSGDELVKFESKAFKREQENLQQEHHAASISLSLARIEFDLLQKTNPLDLEAAERTAAVAATEWDDFVKQGEAIEKQTADENLKMAQDSLDGAQEELKQLEKMYKADDLTEETEEIILKRARREAERAEFMLKTAKIQHGRRLEQEIPREKRLKEVARDREAINLQKTRDNLPVTLSQKQAEIEKLSVTLHHLQSRLQQMQQDQQLLTLKAPIDGVVVYGQAEHGKWTTTDSLRTSLRPGGTITPHQIIMTIIPDHGTQLWVEIPEKDFGQCQTGQSGQFRATAFPESSIPGQLTKVSRVFARDGFFSGLLEWDIPQNDPRLKPLLTGMTGKVRLVQFSSKNVLAVPTTAVFTDDENPNQHYVYVSNEGMEPRKQTVETGLSSAIRTHIKSGLQAGDKILLSKPEDN